MFILSPMQVTTEPSKWVHLDLGVRVATSLRIDADDDSWPFTVRATASAEGARLVVDSITFRRKEGVPDGINADGLRAVPIGDLLRRALARSVKFASSPDPTMSADPTELDEQARLRRAAVVYRLASLEGAKATQAVGQDLGVSRATAGRIIARARELGLLGAAIGPRSGEEV